MRFAKARQTQQTGPQEVYRRFLTYPFDPLRAFEEFLAPKAGIGASYVEEKFNECETQWRLFPGHQISICPSRARLSIVAWELA